MFKDIYQAANDDIKPDPYLLTRILNKSEEKPKPFLYRYRFPVLAAVIALVIAIPGLIHTPGNNTNTLLKENILPEARNDSIFTVLSDDTVSETNNTMQQAIGSQTVSGSSRTNDINNTPSTSVSLYDSQPSATEDKVAKKESLPVAEDFSAIQPEYTVVMSVNNVAPAPAMAYARAFSTEESEEAPLYESITATQYFEKLGFSPDSLDIPETLSPDFSADTEIQVLANGEEILPGEQTFTYSGEKTLNITLSESTETATSYINSDQYEKSVFGDKNAVVLYDGSVYEAHIVHNSGTALKIVTDLSEDELKELLVSAAQ